ncbi:Tn3 family transposase, partial [Escherichia coli]
TLKMPAFEWVHVQLHQQKGMISLSPPTICNSAKESGSDPYAAIEAVIPWDEFTESVSEAELLARPEGFDHLHLVGENFATLRRYTPALLEVLELRAAPAAQGVLAAVQTLREMNADNLRKVPADAPTAF